MRKRLIMIIVLLILSGCSNEYNLTIENGKFKEEINIVIPKSMHQKYDSVEGEKNPETYVEEDDQLTPFLNNEQYAVGNKKYNKKVTEDNDNYYVDLSYDYTPEEFENGRVLSGCFEDVKYEYNDDYYLINLSGRFYCLYGKETVINIKTSNIVEDNNSNKVKGDTYTWTINNDNVNDVDISIKVLKKTKVEKYTLIILIVASVVALISLSLFIYQKITNRKKNNEI